MNRTTYLRKILFACIFSCMLLDELYAKLYPEGEDTDACIVKSYFSVLDNSISISLICLNKQGALLVGGGRGGTINYTMSYMTTNGVFDVVSNGETFPMLSFYLLPGVTNLENRPAFSDYSFAIPKPDDFRNVDELVHVISIIPASSLSSISINSVDDIVERIQRFHISSTNWDSVRSPPQKKFDTNESR